MPQRLTAGMIRMSIKTTVTVDMKLPKLPTLRICMDSGIISSGRTRIEPLSCRSLYCSNTALTAAWTSLTCLRLTAENRTHSASFGSDISIVSHISASVVMAIADTSRTTPHTVTGRPFTVSTLPTASSVPKHFCAKVEDITASSPSTFP